MPPKPGAAEDQHHIAAAAGASTLLAALRSRFTQLPQSGFVAPMLSQSLCLAQAMLAELPRRSRHDGRGEFFGRFRNACLDNHDPDGHGSNSLVVLLAALGDCFRGSVLRPREPPPPSSTRAGVRGSCSVIRDSTSSDFAAWIGLLLPYAMGSSEQLARQTAATALVNLLEVISANGTDGKAVAVVDSNWANRLSQTYTYSIFNSESTYVRHVVFCDGGDRMIEHAAAQVMTAGKYRPTGSSMCIF